MSNIILVVTRTVYYPGQRRPLRDHYYAQGPDGARFDNSSFAELRRVIRRHYGLGVTVALETPRQK